jgi:hypothetical protein
LKDVAQNVINFGYESDTFLKYSGDEDLQELNRNDPEKLRAMEDSGEVKVLYGKSLVHKVTSPFKKGK